jgi:hypothetical protein
MPYPRSAVLPAKELLDGVAIHMAWTHMTPVSGLEAKRRDIFGRIADLRNCLFLRSHSCRPTACLTILFLPSS